MAVRKLEHIGIMVQSLEKSITFYQDVIGLQCIYTIQPNETVRLAFLAFPNSADTEIELVEKPLNETLPSDGKVNHVAFTVDDINAEFARIQALQLPLITPAIVTIPDGSRYFFFEGPDGERLEFFQSTRL